jgi:hypothetical protein
MTLPRRGGLALVGAGLLVQTLGLLAEIDSLARLGLPAMVVGVGLAAGRPGPPVTALSLWAVPIPTAILAQGSPGLETWIARLASLPFMALGANLEVSGPLLQADSDRLELTFFHGGIPLAVLAAELGWYMALRAGRSLPMLTVRAIVAAGLAPGLQIAAAAVAFALLLSGSGNLARCWLDCGQALLLSAGCIAWAERPVARAE